MSPDLFNEPERVRLDRWPNRHVSFGIGLHRCLGANVAEVVWTSAIVRILERLPDFTVHLDQAVRYPDVGASDGWISTPATFTPGRKVGATLNEDIGAGVTRIASGVAESERGTEDI
jgi:cytochrome P450